MTAYTIGSQITARFEDTKAVETVTINTIEFADCTWTGWKAFWPVINGRDVMVSDTMRNDLRASFGVVEG